jgi:hypothetical protein
VVRFGGGWRYAAVAVIAAALGAVVTFFVDFTIAFF